MRGFLLWICGGLSGSRDHRLPPRWPSAWRRGYIAAGKVARARIAPSAPGERTLSPPPRISVCICTRNRPDDVAKAIGSVLESRAPAHEIIVSDDSTGGESRELVTSRFPSVVFVEGPRKGLGANRNNALSRASGTHVAFIDDDVEMDPDFIGIATDLADRNGERAIVSGIEINNGAVVRPLDMTFLGHQSVKYSDGGDINTIVINSTVFPIGLFRSILFDPTLIYGSDEIDLTNRALTLHGFRIVFDERLRNRHYPSPASRDYYSSFIEASRIYVMFKKYFLVDRDWMKGLAFVAVAYPHILLYYIKQNGFVGLPRFGRTFATSIRYISICLRNPSAHV